MFARRGPKFTSFGRGMRAGVVVVVLAASAFLVPGAGAAPEQKSYTADVSPHAVGAGQTIAFTLTVVNTSGSQQIGSANLTAPSTFTLISTGSPSPSGTATPVGGTGGTLELRNLALPAGGTMTVTFTAEVPCEAGAYFWSIIAKQSNNFSGPPGNNFILDEAGSNLLTTVSGQCSVRWLTQPRDAKTGTSITNTPYDAAFPPTGGPFIQAEVQSAPSGDASTTRVSFSSYEITLAIGNDASGGTAKLSGTKSATTTSGVATFSPGPRIDVAGPNYTLLATNPIMVAGESDPFDISDAVCAAPCTTQPTGHAGTTSRVTSDSSTGFVAVSVGVDVKLTCPDYMPPPGQQVVAILPLSVFSGSTLLIETTLDASIVDRSFALLRVCYASTNQFIGRDGTPADPVTIAGDALFRDVLPDCDRREPVPPCQLPTTRDPRTGDVTIRVLAPGDDPYKK